MLHETFKIFMNIISNDDLNKLIYEFNILHLEAPNMMPFNIQYLGSKGQMNAPSDMMDKITLRISHNYIQDGYLIFDPDMTIKIYPKLQKIIALTLENDIIGTVQRTCSEDGSKINPIYRKKLNEFLNEWLLVILEQRYRIKKKQKEIE